MSIVILGNGPSLKSVHDYGFEKFLTHCKDKNIKVLCMNKILRYFEKEKLSIYPDYYVASDTLVNIQMYDEILNQSIGKSVDNVLSDMQNKYYGECYTFYPNICISDVSESDIRSDRDQNSHSKRMRWDLLKNYI